MSQAPLGLLTVMLSINDCKERFSANNQNIADGLRPLVNMAKRINIWRDQPRVLIVAPSLSMRRSIRCPESG